MPTHQALYLGRANKRHTDNVRSPNIQWCYDNESDEAAPLDPHGEHVERSRSTRDGIVFCWIEESKESGHSKRRAMVHRIQSNDGHVVLDVPVDLTKIVGASPTWDMPLHHVEQRLLDAIVANPSLEADIRDLAMDAGVELD